MMRPRVICHMMTSIDGRIVPDGWPISLEERREYEVVQTFYDAQAWMCGRVTMEAFAKDVRSGAEIARTRAGGPPREDHRARGEHASFAFALDPAGKLAWTTSHIEGDHVVAILGDRVSDEYLAFLRSRGVSYILAGSTAIDLPLALERIGAGFGVHTLLLEGGGVINGTMLRAGLIDEVSLLVAPVVDGRVGTAALVDLTGGNDAPWRLSLEAMEKRAGDVVWLRYRIVPRSR